VALPPSEAIGRCCTLVAVNAQRKPSTEGVQVLIHRIWIIYSLPIGRTTSTRVNCHGGPIGMNTVHEADLAWKLIEDSRSRLDVAALNKTFVTVGTGDYEGVIDILMNVAASSGGPVSDELMSQLAVWVEGFRGHERYANRLSLLDQITTRSSASTLRR